MSAGNRPVVLFGIDGATYSILDPFIDAGRLPNLSRMKREGAWGVLQSTIHPLTPAAWISMVTGLNPAKHGVYDFLQRKEASYGWELTNRQSWTGDPIWSLFNQQNRKVGVFNLPMTFPPDTVDGFMISGMGTPPESQNFIQSTGLAARFKEQFPRYAVEPDPKTTDLDEYLAHNEQLLEQRIEALRFVWREYPDLDFFMPVFIVTDRIHHVYWRFIDPGMPDYDHPQAATIRNRIGSIYEKIDAILGELWVWVSDRGGYILVVSDHGFGPLLKDVYLNKWLIDQGYLVLKPDAESYYIIEERFFTWVDWDQTRAYSFGNFGNINLNLHGREPRGIVEPGREAEALKQEITERLSQLTDPETGERIVDVIYRREKLYSGIYLDLAPDLLVVMKDYAYITRSGFDFHNDRLTGPPMEHITWYLSHSGNHRLEGIVLIAGDGIKPGFEIQEAAITDIAPTVLYLAGSTIPTGLDGQVLSNIFDEATFAPHPPVYMSPGTNGTLQEDKPVKVQLLEKDIQISLLDDEIEQLRHTIMVKDDYIQALENGRVMRFLFWLEAAKKKVMPQFGTRKE